ncbi:MAG: helix-turn-helix domain-containing protein [Pseudohongiella sp.]|uniref:helix-turn-helix domain-containing protein n=1 Tax=Pseudohongiella sp. TaxID=1979412 RepID=UPI0034A08DDB
MLTALSYFAAQMVAITALALMGLTFLISHPKNINARLFAIICLSSIAYMVATMQYHSNPEFRINLSAYWLPLQILMNMGAGCIMILCYSLFQDMKRFPRWILGVYGIQVLLSALRPLFVSNNLAEIDIESIGVINYFIFGTLPIQLQALFVLAAAFWVVKGWKADVIESRRLLRRVFVIALILFSLGSLVSELYVMNADPSDMLAISAYKTYGRAMVIFVTALYCLKFEPVLEKVAEAMHPGHESDTEDGYELELDRFHSVFRDQKAYLKPGLSIAELATQLAMPQYKLRHLINKQLGFRNFNALLNLYRVNEACEYLADPKQNHLPVLTIALTVGYQSIAPFNQAFRELKEMPPTEFRKQSQRESYLAQRATPSPLNSF